MKNHVAIPGARRLMWALLFCSPLAAGGAVQDVEGPDSLNWPKEIEAEGAKILVYQPQLESLKGNELGVRAAVSVQKAGADAPVFGGIWFTSHLLTDRDRRTATPIDVRITSSRFPNSTPDEAADLGRILSSEVPKWRLTLSLDHLLAQLKLVDERKAAAQGLQNAPPRIVYRNHPAMILHFEGEPSWKPIASSRHRRVSNSSFFVLEEAGTAACYLRVPPYWWKASSPMGPWDAVESVPADIEALWNQEPKDDLPPPDAGQDAPERPEVIVATEPTELLWTRGQAQYDPIEGTDLLHVTNTDSDIFLDSSSRLYYVLLSGRWYRKPQGKGAWSYVQQEELPPDFGRLPATSEMKHVLACVPGTPAAKDAVLDAEIPQTVAVTPGPAPDLSIAYDGDPQFREVPECSVQYAVNTPYSVFLVADRYYCCNDGIWFDSVAARGPWDVCVEVPGDIYLIPPSCPHYYCTYCHVFGANAGEVYVGYYPGYRGCFVQGRTVVYGTGWHYPCWSGAAWYPRPVTWGCGVRYSSSTGNWNFRLGLGGPCAWMGLNYHSDWKGHSVPMGVGGWWTGLGGRRAEVDVHHNYNFVSHVDKGAVHNIYARTPERYAPVHSRLPAPVRMPAPDRRAPNNVYTDHQGETYRKPPEGGWEKHTPEGWKKDVPPAAPARREPQPPPREERQPAPVPKPPPRREPQPAPHDVAPIPAHHVELERQQQARQVGNQRAQEFHQNPPPKPAPKPAPSPPQRQRK
ncbi:MAG TPA: hypothetical protein VKW04_14665 [Planctomycetota bacterium]|nr:hypothetical protein [Planctomycetota bacterium]